MTRWLDDPMNRWLDGPMARCDCESLVVTQTPGGAAQQNLMQEEGDGIYPIGGRRRKPGFLGNDRFPRSTSCGDHHMQMHANTIFITGGTSGIGKGLAETFQKLGNQVIISGRREDRLRDICAANPGMRYFVLDVGDPTAIRTVARKAVAEFPSLNWVFNNAGVQRRLELAPGTPLDDEGLRDEININLLGVIRVAAEFIPHLIQQPNAVLVNVSSGLAFVPLARFPVYCATKAAVHSFTLSLRHQLKGSGVKVIELIPPYVATELGGPRKTVGPGGPQPMPLEAFIAETLRELATGADEVAIGDARNLVAATNPEALKTIFTRMNR
jgi:uncharacterized oxidoreductase